MATLDDSTNDLLRVFETDNSIAPSMAAAATTTSAPVNNVSSNILGEINAATNYQEEELLQLLNDNDNAPRDSNRRSSILKVNEKGNFRRISQRVSWAQKYQFKEVRSDGSIVITSQEMNKFDSESPTALQSAGFDVNRQACNENASIITSPMAPCSAVIDDPVQELANLEVLQRVKEKVKNSKSYTGILSRFYNKEDEEDRQTVIHTAINRFGIDIDPTTTTDLNCLFDAANLKEKPDLLNDSDNANLNNFVQQFVEQQKKQEQFVQLQSELTTSTAASSHQPPGISPIAGNIKTKMRMNMSTYQQVCNSTGVGTNQLSPEEYWFDTVYNMVESMDVEKGTSHDTTMMDIDIDSSDSNEKISQSAAVSQPKEPSKDSSALLALLKGTNNEADLATGTLEFSFQQQQPQPTADEPQPSLGAILVDGLANNSDKENVNQEDEEIQQNDRQVPETDLLDILPSVTKNADIMDMNITMTDDVKSTPEPTNNNSDKENVLFACKETTTQEEPPKPAIVSSPSKRPYDFTMLDSMPEQQQQQSKYIRRISNIPRPITAIAKAPVVERVMRKQIKLDFNQPSTSRNVDNSPNTSRGGSSLFNSPFPPQLAINRVRNSIGFGLKERLIQKVQALQQHREKEAQQQQLELSTRDQTAPAAAAVSEPTENDTQNDNSKMDFTEQSMSLADGTGEKQFSVKLRNSDAVVETKLSSEPKSIAEEENLDEAGKSNCFDISNFTMPDLSSDSDSTSFKLDDFDDEIADSSDALCVDQVASGEQSSSEMNQLIDMVSQSIQSMNDEKMIEESPLNASTSLFNSTAYDIKKILNDTCEFTKFEDLSWHATESLNDFKKFAFEDILYRCISSLDFNALHIRIHKMEPDTCEVRYLWGTLEVRIKFGAIKEKRIDGSQVREMTFHLISLLSSKKAISHEVMRGLEEKALYDGDDMFLRYKEEHRPILILAHNYVINRCDEEYHELIRKYPDSSKLLDLLHDLSNIVDTARQLCVELRHMYSREFMQILDPDSEGRFRFSIRLLGVRLSSHFHVHFTFDPMKYPFEVIRPEIIVPKRDQHLYPIDQFKAALLLVKPGNFNYLTNLIQGARLFICALRKVLISDLKQKQKKKAEMVD